MATAISPHEARLAELEAALIAQREPLATVDGACQRGWRLLEEAAQAGQARGDDFQSPVWAAWRAAHGFMKELSEEVRLHGVAVDQHQHGLERLGGKTGFEFDQYVHGMSQHFKERLKGLDAIKERYLDVSGQVGALAPDDPDLEQMDTLMSLMAYALGDLRRHSAAYVEALDSPAVAELGQAGPAQPEAGLAGALGGAVLDALSAPAELADSGRNPIMTGPESLEPAALKDYIWRTYHVRMEFSADGRPILEPLEGPVHFGPGAALGPELAPEHDPDLSLSLGH